MQHYGILHCIFVPDYIQIPILKATDEADYAKIL
jgi:hypothetical protein